MKGVVFRALEDFVVENWGEAKYEEILAQCPIASGGVYVGPESYPDRELLAIVSQTCSTLNIPTDTAVQSFGRFLFHRLAKSHPEFVRSHRHPASFLMSVNSVIHVEVRKMMQDADPPHILCSVVNPGEMTLEYYSSRRLCVLVHGLLDGVREFFGADMAFEEVSCARQRATGGSCKFVVRYTPAEAVAA